jgi:hypothetical protein
VYQLRVVVRGVGPLIWRQLLIAADTTIAGLRGVADRLRLDVRTCTGSSSRVASTASGYFGGPSFGDDP